MWRLHIEALPRCGGLRCFTDCLPVRSSIPCSIIPVVLFRSAATFYRTMEAGEMELCTHVSNTMFDDL